MPNKKLRANIKKVKIINPTLSRMVSVIVISYGVLAQLAVLSK